MSRASLIAEDGLVHVPRKAVTLEGFRAWAVSDEFPERGRFSFIEDGVYVDMVPEDAETHNKIKTQVTIGVGGMIAARELGVFYGDRMLLTNKKAGLSTEPDSMFAFWDTFKSNRLKRVPLKGRPGSVKEVVGTPDWTLEILSYSSINKDRVLLRRAYHRAGVSEYWMIDALSDDMNFQILTREEDDYRVVTPRKGWHRSPLFGRRFFLERIRDQIGDWAYTLHVRR